MGNELILGLLVGALAVVATAQMPDVLVLGGRRRELWTNPLESHPAAESGAFVVEREGFVTNNWRGYVATWVIDGDRLYLTGLEAPYPEDGQGEEKADLAKLFPGQYNGGRVHADWFTGELRVPDGKMIDYVHMGYGSTFTREILIAVEKGVVKSRTVRRGKR